MFPRHSCLTGRSAEPPVVRPYRSLGLPTLDFRFLQGTHADCTHLRLLVLGSPVGPDSSSLIAPRAMVLRGELEGFTGSLHA